MNINIICVGKLKEDYLKSAIVEYSKRLKRFCKLNIIEINDEKIPDNASKAEEDKILDTESVQILKHINPSHYNIVLCIEGKALSSEEFSDKLSDAFKNGKSTINFVIGSSLGLSPKVKDIADIKLSFSKMTFPHQLMRVVLLEQVYRSFKIMSNEKYHK